MTDTDTQTIRALASRLAIEFASEDQDELRAAAHRLQATDPNTADLARRLADLAEDIDAIDNEQPIPTRNPQPSSITMGDQLTLVTDTGRIDGAIRQIWIGNTNITEAVTSDGLKFTGDADGNRIIADATIAVLGPITATAEETLA
jgi:hypothetical protein